MLGGLALGLGSSAMVYAAPPEPPLQLRLSHELSPFGARHAPATLDRPEAMAAAGPVEAPFKLHWSHALEVAQFDPPAPAEPASPPDDTPIPPSRTNALVRRESPALPTESVPSPPPEKDEQGSGSKYGLAPIRWGGDISYAYSKRRSDDSEATTNHIYQITSRANSYILYPWLARVDGSLSLALIENTSRAEDAPTTGNVAVTGALGVDIFPRSRFPFRGEVSASDTRTSGALASTEYRTYRLNLRQNYRPARGAWHADGAFSASVLDGDFGQDTVYRLEGGYAWRDERQNLEARSNLTQNTVTGGATSQTFLALANHSYAIDEATRVDSGGTLAMVDIGSSGAGIGGISTSVLQLYTVGSWTPLDSKWRATGSARISRTGFDSPGGSSSNTTLSLQGTTNYRASQNLNLNGSATLTGSPDSGSESFVGTVAGGAVYTGDPLRFGNNSYNWSVSANLSNTTSSDTNFQTAGVGGTHGLSRNWILGERAGLTGSLNQSANTFRSTGEGGVTSSSLGHSASLALYANPTDETVGSIGLNLSDTRTYGDNPGNFRSLGLQFNGNWRISARSSLSGNMTWQKALQSTSRELDPLTGLPIETDSDDTDVNGSINYVHTRAFGIRGLIYSLQYSATSSRGKLRQFGDPDATREGDTRNIDQRLNYRIGRLDTQLQLRVAEVDGKKSAVLFFRVSRSFGAF